MSDDFEDLDLNDDEESDDHVRLSKADLKKLRAAAKRAGVAERELSDLKREKTVREAGIDGLSQRQISALAREAGDDANDPVKLRELAVEFGWATPSEQAQEQQQVETEIAAQSEAANVAVGGESPAVRAVITPDDANAWPVDKQMRFDTQHPDLYERLLRGEQVPTPAGFS